MSWFSHLVDIIGGGDAAQHESLRQREHAQEDEVVRGPPSRKRMIRKKWARGSKKAFLDFWDLKQKKSAHKISNSRRKEPQW